MDRQEILSKYINDDRLLVSKLLDKIEFVNKRNSVEYTEFLDMRQRQLLEKVMAELKVSNYVATGGYKTAERTVRRPGKWTGWSGSRRATPMTLRGGTRSATVQKWKCGIRIISTRSGTSRRAA